MLDRPETFLVISKRDNLFKKISKIWFGGWQRSFSIGKNGSGKSYIKEKEILFSRKN